jgi:soluble lytic murein transglycosylase
MGSRLCLSGLLGLLLSCHAFAGATPPSPTPAGATPPSTTPDPVRDEFTAAMQRVRLHTPEPPDSAALQHYVIYDYLVTARLRRDLVTSPSEDLDGTVDAFLHEHIGQPVSRALRGEWLVSLAARHRWDWFLPRAADVNTSQLICDRLAGRLATNDTAGLATEALARWSLPQKQPPECEPVFAWLRSQGLLTPALAESRTRSALAADNPRLAREFADDVPSAAVGPLLQWARLLETPKPALTLLAENPEATVEPVALDAGFSKLARTSPADALNLLPSLLERPEMTPAARWRLQRTAALGAAYSRDPGALGAFSHLPKEAIDSDVQEWRVRAALWAGDHAQALSWIEKMSANLASQPRWRYWRARMIESSGEPARELYGEIAGLRDFYGYLAADRLHRDYDLNARPSPDVESAQDALAATPGLMRAHALFDCGMVDDAFAEWAAVVSNTEPDVKVQAAHLAARWGWYTQSIETLAQVGELDDVRMRYPRPYADAIAEASKLTQLPPDWILAVMRQESLFRYDAVSRAGARGLMQMLPATSRAVEHRWHLPPPDRSPTDTGSNVQLGAAYLRDLLDRYGGQLGLSLAAYNAGPIPVARWLPPKSMDADIWIENIPYGETRAYVQRVFEHIVAFAWVRDGELPHITELLPAIDPTVTSMEASSRAPIRTGAARNSSKRLQGLVRTR